MDARFTVVYSDRKTVSLSVERDGSIVVHAPHGTPEDRIQQAVEAKKLWLFAKANHKRKYPKERVRKESVTGETILYLGRNYRLQIVDDDLPGVRFDAGFYVSRGNQPVAAQLIQQWYVQRAMEKLPPRCRHFAQALGVTFNRVLVSDLKVRWASCTPHSNLNFSWRIMKAPTFVIDYLIVHELAHLIEPNHTPAFWNIVAVQVPRHETAKEWLRDHGAMLEQDF